MLEFSENREERGWLGWNRSQECAVVDRSSLRSTGQPRRLSPREHRAPLDSITFGFSLPSQGIPLLKDVPFRG
jgi:hypothetical protein